MRRRFSHVRHDRKAFPKAIKAQKSVLAARCEFGNRAREAGETVSQYVAVLRHLVTDCKFNDAM